MEFTEGDFFFLSSDCGWNRGNILITVLILDTILFTILCIFQLVLEDLVLRFITINTNSESVSEVALSLSLTHWFLLFSNFFLVLIDKKRLLGYFGKLFNFFSKFWWSVRVLIYPFSGLIWQIGKSGWQETYFINFILKKK